MKTRSRKTERHNVMARWGSLVGIRGQVVLGFTTFVFIILIVVWVFQVLMLDFFYEQTKMSELTDVIDNIESFINDDGFDDRCGVLASDHDACICVYQVENGSVKERLVSKDVAPTCVIHHFEKDALNNMYRKSLSNEGTWTERYTLGRNNAGRIEKGDDVYRDSKKNEEYLEIDGNYRVIAVAVKALVDDDGNEYAAYVNVSFTPMHAVEQTRSAQFWYMAIFVIIAAIIFAFVFSSKVARPLEKMTASAEKLAQGDYSPEFEGEGYLETQRLAKTLNYAAEEISKTDKLRNELIANVSHDLRTPLTLISGYAEMMRDIPGEHTPENLQIIIEETQRLNRLVNDILDLSKYSNVNSANIQIIDLTEIVRATMLRYTELVRQDGYVISFEAERDVNILADESMILQVVYNLINNAVNYAGDDKKVIVTQTVSEDGKVRITVKDNGDGIEPGVLPYIWDRYYKVDKVHKRAVSGSGLGLSIVRRLLELHSASFGVESAVGSGSSFWFEFPVYKE